jgi:hypothetical protein
MPVTQASFSGLGSSDSQSKVVIEEILPPAKCCETVFNPQWGYLHKHCINAAGHMFYGN